jgi:hypothetical protein
MMNAMIKCGVPAMVFVLKDGPDRHLQNTTMLMTIAVMNGFKTDKMPAKSFASWLKQQILASTFKPKEAIRTAPEPSERQAFLLTLPVRYDNDPEILGYLVEQLAKTNPNFDRVVEEVNAVGSRGGHAGGTPGMMPEKRTEIIEYLKDKELPVNAGLTTALFSDDDTDAKNHQVNSMIMVWALHMLGMPLNEKSSRHALTDWFRLNKK